MTPQPDKTRRPGAAADLAARIGALPQAKPAGEGPSPQTSPRRRSAGSTGPGKPQPAAAAPAEQVRPGAFYDERLSITTTADQVRALRAARLADGIQATARLRAMIDLWQRDPTFRDRIDRAAGDWR